jgi:HK97 gp10 family phage protein
MDSNANITGLADLQKMLERLAPDIEKKVMRGALRAGQKQVLEQARAAVHPISGDLAKSLRIKTRAKGGCVSATLVVGNKTAYYAHMVEFGTAPHFIRPKGKKSLFFAGLTKEVINHPGARKKPFMRPAFDQAASGESAAFEAVKAYLAKRINKELSKLPDETDGVTDGGGQ